MSWCICIVLIYYIREYARTICYICKNVRRTFLEMIYADSSIDKIFSNVIFSQAVFSPQILFGLIRSPSQAQPHPWRASRSQFAGNSGYAFVRPETWLLERRESRRRSEKFRTAVAVRHDKPPFGEDDPFKQRNLVDEKPAHYLPHDPT